MKKFVLGALFLSGLSLINSNVSAYSESQDGSGCRAAGTFCSYSESEDKLNEALKMRNRYYNYTHRISNGEYKTVHNQLFRHRAGRAMINVDETSTIADREGALKDVPYYADRKAVNQNNFWISNNAKQNWRRAAVNYYANGENGYTNKIGMTEGVLYGSQGYKANPWPLWQATKAEPSKGAVRDDQKEEMGAGKNLPRAVTGEQKTTQRSGDYTRNLYSPYQASPAYENPNYLRTLRMLMNEAPAVMESSEAE